MTCFLSRRFYRISPDGLFGYTAVRTASEGVYHGLWDQRQGAIDEQCSTLVHLLLGSARAGGSVETSGIHMMRASPANRHCLTERKENSSAPVSHGGVLFLQDAMKPLVEVGAACQACSNQTSHTSPRCKSAAPESSTSATFFAPDTWTQNSRSGVAFALRLQLQRLTSPAGPS